jgi:hypothetical protein
MRYDIVAAKQMSAIYEDHVVNVCKLKEVPSVNQQVRRILYGSRASAIPRVRTDHGAIWHRHLHIFRRNQLSHTWMQYGTSKVRLE